jgi:hypothetical protein
MNEIKKIPYLGIGMGLRTDIAEDTFAHGANIDAVEIITENFFSHLGPKKQTLLDRSRKRFHVIPHGIQLSIGSCVPIPTAYLKEVKRLTDLLKSPYYSDHFAFVRHDDLHDIGHLSPIWYTKETLEEVVKRVDQVQQFLGIPLVLENITASYAIPEADYEEPEFIAEVCRRTGCGFLLDVTNILINSYNRHEDAQKLIERYPMDRVVHVHLAGGEVHDGHFYDSHSAEISGPNEGVWPLLEWVARHADIKVLIIERDDDFKEDFEAMVLKDLARARAIVEAGRAAA